MDVFLVPIGRGRHELYSETPPDDAPSPPGGRVSQFFGRMKARWDELVHAARTGLHQRSRLRRWRDQGVCQIAESIAEQRTLWALRDGTFATLVYPIDMDASHARAVLDEALSHARRHHRLWLSFDLAALVVSGVLALVPGPNLIAYYFAVRVAGHYLSWRGATRALDRTSWDVRAEPALAELRPLADAPRDTRAADVAAIAARLQLPRLASFFDRAAVPAG